MKNQLLAATEQKIRENMIGRGGQTLRDFDKIVNLAGQEAMKGGPNSILASLKQSKNPIHDCVVGAINMAIILRKKSRNTMPVDAMIPAATVLMLHALDFAEMMNLVHVDKPELDQATHLLVDTLFKRLGITPQMLQTAAQKVHSFTKDPVAMEKMKLMAGMTKHPNAPVPTPMPAEQTEPEEVE